MHPLLELDFLLLPYRRFELLLPLHPPLSCQLQPLAHNRQPLATVAHSELGLLPCNRQCLMPLAILRQCHLVLLLALCLWTSSFCCIRQPLVCNRQPLVCNRQPLVLSALLRLEHLGRLIASSES